MNKQEFLDQKELPENPEVTATKLEQVPVSEFVEARKEVVAGENESEDGAPAKEEFEKTTKAETKEIIKDKAFGGIRLKTLEKQVGNEMGLKNSKYWERRNLFVRIKSFLQTRFFKNKK